MADTATTALRFRDQESGGNDGTWGTLTDVNFALVEEAISGVLTKDISGSGTTTLSTTNFVSDEARHMTLKLTGTLTGISYVVLPNVEKLYFIHNATGGEFTVYVKTSSGDSVEIPVGKDIIYVDGSNVITTLLGASLANIVSAVNTGTLATLAANIAAINGVYANATNITTVSGINGNVTSVANNSTNINAVAGNKTNIDSVAGNSSNINTVAGVSSNVTTVAGISSNVTTVAGISSAVSGVNTIASHVSAVNTDPFKTNITNVSGNSSNINAVAGNSSNINTVAGISSNVTTVAGISTDVSGVNAIASDVTAVENIASNVTTVAGIASNVTAVAGVASNVTTVAGVASNVTTVAGIASNVTTVAGMSGEVTNFALVYHGAAGSDPSARSNSSSNQVGDLYFNSSDNRLEVFTSSGWQAAALDSSAFVTADADLTAIGALSKTDGNFIVGNGSTWVAESGATARTSLGLGTIATQANDSVNIDGGAIDGTAIGANSATTIVGTTITANTSLLPDASGGADIGSATAEWGDIYIADDKQIKFGNDQDVTMEYDEDGTDTLLITGNTTLADGSYNLNIASHDGTNGLALAGTVVTTTAAELNLIDGDTARGTTAVASGDGLLVNDGGTMRMTNVDTVSTYFASHNVGGSNIVTTGALDSGSITSGFGAIDNGTSGIRTNTVTIETSLLPDASGGADIGSATAEFGDIYIADDKQIKFGSDQDVTMEYDEDGTDSLLISGGDVTIADDKKLYFGTGQDVYLEYDEDGTDKLIIKGNTTFLDGSYNFDIASHDGTNGLALGGTVVTSSATELNKLDGISTTATELGYVNGVTSAIQTQLNTKASTGKAIAMAMVFG